MSNPTGDALNSDKTAAATEFAQAEATRLLGAAVAHIALELMAKHGLAKAMAITEAGTPILEAVGPGMAKVPPHMMVDVLEYVRDVIAGVVGSGRGLQTMVKEIHKQGQ